ncbi:MAG: hypothetical protein INQ03_23795 [Candidatus Heimdallarchaeota archaeon]|nr:hypothetical protein [Candidatus Heimdallarchaeota archaeon]
MKKYFPIIMIMGILLLSLQTSSAAAPWDEGTEYEFSEVTSIESTIDDGTMSDSLVLDTSESYKFIIDDIDNGDKLIFLTQVGGGGQAIEDTVGDSFNATTLGSNLFTLSVFAEDDADGDMHITGFNFDFNFWIFVEPEFTDINDEAKALFEDDMIKNTFGSENMTYEEFLDDATSFSFMGESTCSDAIDAFDDQNSWEFSIDLSNILEYDFYDEEEEDTVYEKYTKYELKVKLEYDNDGVLKSYTFKLESEVETEYAIITNSITETFAAGSGFAAAIAGIPGYTFSVAMLSIIIIPVIRMISKEGRS